VKTVAENNKLHIKVSSEHNMGTTFSVIFHGVEHSSVPQKVTQQPGNPVTSAANSPAESLEPNITASTTGANWHPRIRERRRAYRPS
jgi:hypothetical protein